VAIGIYGYSSVSVMPARRVAPVRPAPVRAVDNAKVARLANLDIRVNVYSRRGAFRPPVGRKVPVNRVLDIYV
jgi:hypothetical protein